MASDPNDIFALVKTLREDPLHVYDPGELGMVLFCASGPIKEALGVLGQTEPGRKAMAALRELAEVSERLEEEQRTALGTLFKALETCPDLVLGELSAQEAAAL